jgi:hypothetical protein
MEAAARERPGSTPRLSVDLLSQPDKDLIGQCPTCFGSQMKTVGDQRAGYFGKG